MATLAKLTKQQQYVIMGGLLACGVFFAIINFMVVPLISEWKANLPKFRLGTIISTLKTH